MRQIKLLDLIVEPEQYTVYRVVALQRELIDLPKLSFELLMYLIDNAEKICSLEQISKAVWGKTVVNNETIVQRITLLRKVLSDDPKAPTYIESVRGRGYRLIVQPVFISKQNYYKLFNSAVAALIMISIIGAGYWVILHNAKDTESPPLSNASPLSEASNTVDALISRGNYYFSIGQKSNIDSAIELFREAVKLEPGNQAALVGLSLALSKSVCRYNQPPERALEASKLATKALSIEATNIVKSKAQAALAYSLDCIGNMDRALEHYLLSFSLDPNNYASIGSAAHLLEIKGELIDAYKLSVQAKQLAANNYMADLQLARIFELLKFTSQAQESYQKLFTLYPDNVFINEAYPRFLYFQRRFTEAKTQLQNVFERGIERQEIFLYYAELVWLLEGKDEALQWFYKAGDINPDNSYPNTINLLLNGQLTAKQANERIRKLEGLVAAGDRWPINYIEASLIAVWALNDQEMAISLLRKAVDLGYLNSEYLTISPLFANLNSLPEFYQLIDEINRRREQIQKVFLASYPPPEA